MLPDYFLASQYGSLNGQRSISLVLEVHSNIDKLHFNPDKMKLA